jgi:hypothetical protein
MRCIREFDDKNARYQWKVKNPTDNSCTKAFDEAILKDFELKKM